MRYLLAALLLLLASPALAQQNSSAGGVTQLVAGSNISLSPTNGKGKVTVTASGSLSTAFNNISGGTNTSAAMLVGSGASLGFTGTGTVNANELGGVPLLGGTFTNTDYCTYSSSGTLLNCNNALGSGVATALAITHDTTGGICTVGGGGCAGGSGGTGVGVNGGTSVVNVTSTGNTSANVNLETIGTLSGAITRTLPAISSETNSDEEICYDDAAQNITASHTLTIAANAADAINGGSSGGSIGPYTTSGGSICLRITATHNWTVETSNVIPAVAAVSHQWLTSLSSVGAWGQTQPAFTDISGSASAAQMSTNLSAAIDSALGSTQGDILYRGASGWASLGPGTSGNFLKTQGASANPTWAAVSATGCAPAGSANEVLLDNGSGGCADVSGLGSSGNVLTSNGAGNAPTWQPGGGGGVTCPTGFTASGASCIWTQTASNSGSIAWTGLANSEYTLKCTNIIWVNSGGTLGVQFGEGGTPTWETGASAYIRQGASQAGAGTLAAGNATASGFFDLSGSNSGTIGTSFTANFHALATSGVTKTVDGQGVTHVSTNDVWFSLSGDFSTDTNVITAIRVIDIEGSPGNITSGSCSLYYNGL